MHLICSPSTYNFPPGFPPQVPLSNVLLFPAKEVVQMEHCFCSCTGRCPSTACTEALGGSELRYQETVIKPTWILVGRKPVHLLIGKGDLQGSSSASPESGLQYSSILNNSRISEIETPILNVHLK